MEVEEGGRAVAAACWSAPAGTASFRCVEVKGTGLSRRGSEQDARTSRQRRCSGWEAGAPDQQQRGSGEAAGEGARVSRRSKVYNHDGSVFLFSGLALCAVRCCCAANVGMGVKTWGEELQGVRRCVCMESGGKRRFARREVGLAGRRQGNERKRRASAERRPVRGKCCMARPSSILQRHDFVLGGLKCMASPRGRCLF